MKKGRRINFPIHHENTGEYGYAQPGRIPSQRQPCSHKLHYHPLHIPRWDLRGLPCANVTFLKTSRSSNPANQVLFSGSRCVSNHFQRFPRFMSECPGINFTQNGSVVITLDTFQAGQGFNPLNTLIRIRTIPHQITQTPNLIEWRSVFQNRLEGVQVSVNVRNDQVSHGLGNIEVKCPVAGVFHHPGI